MQQRSALMTQPRADMRKQPRPGRDVGSLATKTTQFSRPPDSRELTSAIRSKEHPFTGDMGHQAGDRSLMHRAQPQAPFSKKQVQEQERSEFSGMGGVPQMRGSQQWPAKLSEARQSAESRRPSQARGSLPGQESASQLTFTVTPPRLATSNLNSGRFSPVLPKHFSSKSNEPPDKMRLATTVPLTLRNMGDTMGRHASPVRVSSSPVGPSSGKPDVTSPRNQARELIQNNTSPRWSTDAERMPRSPVGRRDGALKANLHLSPVSPIMNPLSKTLAQGDAGISERRRGISKDEIDEKLLENLNKKTPENKGGRLPDRGRFQIGAVGITTEPKKAGNDDVPGHLRYSKTNTMGLPQYNKTFVVGGHGNETDYQLGKKAQLDRSGAAAPALKNPLRASQETHSSKAAQFQGRNIPALQLQQVPLPVKVPISSPVNTKLNLAKASVDNSPVASQKIIRAPISKKTVTESRPMSPTVASPRPVLVSPVASPNNSPRPSMTPRTTSSKNSAPGGMTKPANTSPRDSSTRALMSPSSKNPPTRTFALTPKQSPTTLPLSSFRTSPESPRATLPGKPAAKLPVDSSVAPTTTKVQMDRYQNPKSRLSAGGDLLNTKGKPKTSLHKGGLEGAATTTPSLAVAKLSVTHTGEHQQSKEVGDSNFQTKEVPHLNKEEKQSNRLPRVRKVMTTSKSYLLPVHNPSQELSHLTEEWEKSGITLANIPEAPPQRRDENRKPPTPQKSRKASAVATIHTEGMREQPRGKTATGRHKRGPRGSKETPPGVDVATALPDTSGNYASAVHQWLRQSHYKVITPQQYGQHETIVEEKAKQPRVKDRTAPNIPLLRVKAQAPEKRRGVAGRRQKESTATPKLSSVVPGGRTTKKVAANQESSKRKPAPSRASRPHATRRKKEPARAAVGMGGVAKGKPAVRPRVKTGPAGDSEDLLSTSASTENYMSASDDVMNEETPAR